MPPLIPPTSIQIFDTSGIPIGSPYYLLEIPTDALPYQIIHKCLPSNSDQRVVFGNFGGGWGNINVSSDGIVTSLDVEVMTTVRCQSLISQANIYFNLWIIPPNLTLEERADLRERYNLEGEKS